MGDFKFSFAEFESSSPNTFRKLWNKKDFVDVTLAANDDFQIAAHKIILSASSPLLKRILTKNPHNNPLIYLHNISSTELELIIEFIYLGTCNVAQAGLINFLAAGKALEIRGLADELEDIADKPVQQTTDYGGGKQNAEFQSNFPPSKSDENTEPQAAVEKDTGQGEDGVKLENSEEVLETSVKRSSTENTTSEAQNSYEIHNSEFTTKSVKDLTGRVISTRYKNEEFIRNTVGQFSCKECDYKNLKSGKLIRHVIAVHEKRKFNCSFCDFQSGYKNALQSHIQVVHQGIRFSCKECHFSATQRSTISVHMTTVHKLFKKFNIEDTLNCTKCDHKASSIRDMSKHLKDYHI